MTENEHVTPTSKLAEFFFHNKTSVASIIVVMILASIFIPEVGILVPMIIALIALFTCLKSGSINMIGLNRPKSWTKTILLGAVIGFLLQLLFHSLLEPCIELITGIEPDLSKLDVLKGNISDLISWIAIGWISGGLLEEISFRGYLIPRVRSLIGENSLGTTIAVLVSTIPFGLAHMYQDWSGVIATGLMGFCFAIIFIKSRYNVWLPIMVHGFANTFAMTLIYLGMADSYRLF